MKERLSKKEILMQLVSYGLVLAMLCSLLPIMSTKVYAESTNTMSVEKFTGNTIVRKGTTVVPRENHKLTVYSFPAGGRYIEEKCDYWIADDDYMVVKKWDNIPAFDDYIELKGKLVTITYDSNGGSAIAPTTDVIAIPEELPIPIKEGYTFGGWYRSATFRGTEVTPGLSIYGDTTLYAKWTEEHIHARHLTKVNAKEATCTENGNKEYYKCSCSLLFADKDAQKEITLAEVEIKAKGHEYESLYDETQHWKKCKNCDAVTEKQEHTSSGEATEENAETCTVCGYVIHEKLQKESSDSSMQWQTLNKAKVFTEKAFADYKAGKESGKSDIANVVAQALKENSLSNVAYEIISYEKTEPTSATEGKISGIVSLAIGGCSTQIPFDYVITKVAEPQKPAQITGKGAQTTDGQIKISWIKADGADGYRIYASACDGESNYKLIKDTKDLTGAIKNLNNKKSYKFYVVAYKNVDGKKIRICKSMIYHVVLSDSKYTNVKAIKVAKTSYTLNVGDKQKLNAKSVKQEKNKKLLTHAQEFRYSSSDTTVATVSKTGEITAKQSGSCIIYVVANNGVMKKIKVNVA